MCINNERKRMKKGFMLPVVLILMAMLMGVSLVLNKISVDKTNALSTQQDSYYIKKEMTITLEEESFDPGGESPFTDAVALNSDEGRITFFNNGHVRKSIGGKLWARDSQIVKGDSYTQDTCKVVDGITGNDTDCTGREEFFPCKYKFTLPAERFSQIRNISVNSGSEPSNPAAITEGNYRMPDLTQWDAPVDLRFIGGGVYHITNFRADRRMEAAFDPARYIFDNIEFTTGYNTRGGYSLDFASGSEVWVKGELKLEGDTKARLQGDRVYINRLVLNNSNIELTLGEGIYWIEEIVFKNTGNKIIIPSGDKVKIYTNKITVENTGSSMNEGGKPSQLLIANYSEDIRFQNSNFNLNGFIYTEGTVELVRSRIYGGVICKNLEIRESSAYVELYNEEGVQLPTRYSIENEYEMW